MSAKVKKLTVPEAAAIMGVTPQFLRMGLRHGKFPFGDADKLKRRSYYITAESIFSYMAGRDMAKHGQGQEREAINL